LTAIAIAIAYLGTVGLVYLYWFQQRATKPSIEIDPVELQKAMDTIGVTLSKHENKIQTLMAVHALRSGKETRA
jgi:hypothetical protein